MRLSQRERVEHTGSILFLPMLLCLSPGETSCQISNGMLRFPTSLLAFHTEFCQLAAQFGIGVFWAQVAHMHGASCTVEQVRILGDGHPFQRVQESEMSSVCVSVCVSCPARFLISWTTESNGTWTIRCCLVYGWSLSTLNSDWC